MDIEPHIKLDMSLMGCKCPRKIALAYQLYVHLIEEKLMHEVKYKYSQPLDILYMTAKPSKTDRENIYIPIPTSDALSLNDIWKIEDTLCTPINDPCINFAYMESDTTVAIYNFYNDFVAVDDPETVMRRHKRDERRHFIDAELHKNGDLVFDNCFRKEEVCDIDDT